MSTGARVSLYLAGLVLALPGALLAMAMLALGRLIAIGNLWVFAWEAFFALAWLLPVAGIAIAVMLGAAFFRSGRLLGAIVLIAAGAGVVSVLLAQFGVPADAGEAAFLVPTVASVVCGVLVLRAEMIAPAATVTR